MKIKKFNEINEGMKVNPNILELYGEYNIDEVIEKLNSILNGNTYISIFQINSSFLEKSVFDEINTLLINIENWKNEGANFVDGGGLEWIPLW